MTDYQTLRADNLINTFLANLPYIVGDLSTVIQPLLYIFIAILSVIFLGFVITIFARLFFFFKSLKNEEVFLELTPPSKTEQSAYSTEQLFLLIHTLGNQRSILERIFGIKPRFSLEIASTKSEGIRYLLRADKKEVGAIKKSVLAYLPHVKIQKVYDYLPDSLDINRLRIVEFKLSNHFAYPLKSQQTLGLSDPISYITGMMTKLEKDELIALQIVLSSAKNKKVNEISNLILRNYDVLNFLKTDKDFGKVSPLVSIIKFLLTFIIIFISIPFWIISNITTNGRSSFPKLPFGKPQTLIKPSTHELEIISSIKDKIEQGLFETSIRLLVFGDNKTEINERIRGIKSSFASFNSPDHQSITSVKNSKVKLINRYKLFLLKKRLLSHFNKSIFSVSEISGIYHFPFTTNTKTENIVKTYSKELPAPLSLKGQRELDVVFAKNNYGGSQTLIGLSEEEREKHMYIIGATGSGKTTMITSLVSQDIIKGKGLAVIDPHGDLAETLLTCIPDNRIDDLIYVNPDDLKYPIGINLLEITPGLDEDDLLREKEFITESVISLFRKVFSESMAGHAHRIEYILRNTIQTALTLENPTLFTIYELLNNPPFQKQATKNLEDENLKNFWKYEYGKAGDYQKVKMISPVAARIGRFLFSPSAKRMLEQKKSTINFDEILEKRKILICNLAKGKLGEDTSEVLGIMVIAKLQLASLRRARMSEKMRKPFYLYVDEFQNFATASFIQMLSEARKYKTYLVMAEQSTSQQKDKNLVNVILANVGTVVSFRSANPEDEKLMLPQFSPFIEKGDIANLPRYNFYIKISAINPEESFSGTTMPVEITFNKEKVEERVQASRLHNAIVYKKPIAKSYQTKSDVNNQKDTNSQDVSIL